MPKNKVTKPKIAVDLPDTETIKNLFPKKVLEKVRLVIGKPKKSISKH